MKIPKCKKCGSFPRQYYVNYKGYYYHEIKNGKFTGQYDRSEHEDYTYNEFYCECGHVWKTKFELREV